MLIKSNEVGHNVWLDVFEHPVQVCNVYIEQSHEFQFIIITRGDDNLPSRGFFSSYVNSGFYLSRIIDCFVNPFNFLG